MTKPSLFSNLKKEIFFVLVKFLVKVLEVEGLPPVLSVSAIIKKGDKLLFIQPFSKKGLNFPGGVVEELETPEQALIRELKEETNLDIKVGRLRKSFPWKTWIAGINFCYEAEIHGGKMKDSPEGQPVWLEPKKALLKMKTPTKKKILEDYLNSPHKFSQLV